MLEKLQTLNKLMESHGDQMNRPASQEDISLISTEAHNKLQVDLPNEYIDFLKIVNGIAWDGFIIYGTDYREDSSKIGLMDNNLVWHENEWPQKYLFLGDSSISWYVFDGSGKRYLELDKPSGRICSEFGSFAQLMDKVLSDLL